MVAGREGCQSVTFCSLLQTVGSRWKCVDIGLLQPFFEMVAEMVTTNIDSSQIEYLVAL